MTDYALDIGNPLIKYAMNQLGIKEDELLQLEFSDFYEKGVNEDVQKIRYEHHIKKLQETVRLIKTFIREERGRKPESYFDRHNTSSSPQSSMDTSKRITDSEKGKEKCIEIINNALSEIERTEKYKSATEKKLKSAQQVKKRLKEDFSKKKNKQDEFKVLQKLNFEKLKLEEAKAQNNVLKTILSSSPRFFRTEDTQINGARSKSNSVLSKRLEAKSFLDNNNDEAYDSDVQARLNSFYMKIEKSKANYEQQLQMKREIASRKCSEFSAKSEKPNDMQTVEKALRIINKHKDASDRRSKSVMKLREEREKLKKKNQDRYSSVQDRAKEQEKNILKKAEYLEKKLKASKNLLEQKQANLNKNIAIKAELHRLRGIDTIQNVERQKRVLNARREQILEKQFMDNQRVEAIKKEKEITVNYKREQALKAMMDKEKALEIAAVIRRAPDHKTAHERLKEIELRTTSNFNSPNKKD
ncbi:unnamed protein product [Blepharisma stoltei]|uniref:Uncharacterized protein n=1 Tax=Blepharisma stoltei TaxID=1481888 RepID=A0AAU9K6V4_9CILI|nr:unnamed protein product [Blepharisma stoltei]